jgi:UDP-glucose 4-epimerase
LKVLVTGGAGYIGSHFVKILLQNNIQCIVLDNLSRGHQEAVPENVAFENIDLLNENELFKLFSKYEIDAIVHFAAFAYVGESVENPKMYYKNNVIGSYNLISAAAEASVNKLVFSSTCSLYGNPTEIPISENLPTNPINPYAQTKLIIEKMLKDYEAAYDIKSVCLRYFNAAGADFSGEIGESHDPEPHLIPIVINTALGKNRKVYIFGDDYNTEDGTCIRDYIHVNDLGDAHLKALEYLASGGSSEIINLGTGRGNSVKEIIMTAKKVTNCEIDYEIAGRRPGDPDVLIADNKKADDLLNWKPKHDLEDIISSAYRWHSNQRY